MRAWARPLGGIQLLPDIPVCDFACKPVQFQEDKELLICHFLKTIKSFFSQNTDICFCVTEDTISMTHQWRPLPRQGAANGHLSKFTVKD